MGADLGKVGYWGPQSKKSVDFHFDGSREIAPAQMEDWVAISERKMKARERKEAVKAQLGKGKAGETAGDDGSVLACGGGTQQMDGGAALH